MIHKIFVNPHTSSIVNPIKMDMSQAYIVNQIELLEERLKCRGYLYLNQIYESLGVEWFPCNSNHWIQYNGTLDNVFAIEDDEERNGFVIKINLLPACEKVES